MSIMSRGANSYDSALPPSQPVAVPAQQGGPDAMFTQDSYEKPRGRAGHLVVPVLLGTTAVTLAPKLLITTTTGLPTSSTVDCVQGEGIGTSMNACMATAKDLYNKAANSF